MGIIRAIKYYIERHRANLCVCIARPGTKRLLIQLTSYEINNQLEVGASINQSVCYCALVEASVKEANTAHLQEGPHKGDTSFLKHFFSYCNPAGVIESTAIDSPGDGRLREPCTHTHSH